ncbi:MAG: hypothetical protein LBF49_02700 [Puniceicoccales bacterium]|jgi:hypothetical protein|nr:hypothetical protein [Puniceicoccales bacterium]
MVKGGRIGTFVNLVVAIGCLICNPSSLVAVVSGGSSNDSVVDLLTDTQEWSIDTAANNIVRFGDISGGGKGSTQTKGSIHVTTQNIADNLEILGRVDSNSATYPNTALHVRFDNTYGEDVKLNSLLTMRFDNNGSTPAKLLNPANPESETVTNAHIYAEGDQGVTKEVQGEEPTQTKTARTLNETVNQIHMTNTGIDLDAGVNLAITRTETPVSPTVVAYTDISSDVVSYGYASAIQASNTNKLTFQAPVSLASSARATATGSAVSNDFSYYPPKDRISSSSVSNVIGSAEAVESGAANLLKLTVNMGDESTDGSTLTSFARCSVFDSSLFSSGGSNVIGLVASYSYMGASVSELNTTLGNEKTLASSSITTSDENAIYNVSANAFHSSSGSNVVGLVLGYSSDTLTVSGSTINLGNANTLTSSSTAEAPSTNTVNSYTSSGSNVVGLSCGFNAASGSKNSISRVSGSTVTLGAGNTLTSSSTANSNSSNNAHSLSGSNIIGLSFGYNNAAYNSVSTGQIENLAANLGDNNILTSSSTTDSTKTTSYAGSNVIGLSFGYNSAVYTTAITNNNLVCKILNLETSLGDNNTLISYALSSSVSGSNVIGLGFGYGDLTSYPNSNISSKSIIGNISNLAVTLGSGNTLTSVAKGTTSGSSVIGMGYGHGAGNPSSSNSFDGSNVLGKISGLSVFLDRDNTLTSCACDCASEPTVAAGSSVIGAAAGFGTTVANCATVNMNGSQTLSALASSSDTSDLRVNTFGADNTDKGSDAFGWRVGIFAIPPDFDESSSVIAENSTVNILAAKLSADWSIGNGVATAILGASQGTTYDTYAHAFPLGEGFKIYVGGRADLTTHLFIPVPSNGQINKVNVCGAISKGRSSANTTGSSFTVYGGWEVNTYGPVQDLARIDMEGGSRWNVYGPASNLPDIHVRSGVLHLAKDDEHASFDDVIGQIQGKITYVDPETGTSYGGSEKKISIDAESYPWNGASGGRLTLSTGHKLTLYVDSSGTESSPTPFSGEFKRVNGYLSIDAGMENALTFEGGKIDLVNISPGEDFKTTNYWIIRSTNNGNVAAIAGMLGLDLSDGENFTPVGDNLYKVNASQEASLFAKNLADYTWLTEGSTAYLFNDGTNDISGLYIGAKLEEPGPEEPGSEPGGGNGDQPNEEPNEGGDNGNPGDGGSGEEEFPEDSLREEEPPEWPEEEVTGEEEGDGGVPVQPLVLTGELPVQPLVLTGESPVLLPVLTGKSPQSGSLEEYYVNGELASLAVAAHTLLSNAISDRLTNVKGRLADPFIHAVYGHEHQNKLAKWGYSNDMGGFVLGIDNVWGFPNETYLRLGTAFGYVHGKTKFSHSTAAVEESAKHDVYMVELFGAYESFNDEQLKTNVGVTLGYGHGCDRLHRVNSELGVFDGKVRSHNIFVGAEIVKNLHVDGGCQFGLWLRGNYSRIAQRGHDDTSTAEMGTQHVSAVNHNLFAVVLGINVEREILDPEHADERWLLSLRAGWECQPMRKHADATILIDNNFGIGAITPAYGQSSKHAAIGTLAVSKKFNANWSVVASYTGRFNEDISTYSLSGGFQYSF